jgi:voltage-gated potassium channel
MPAPASGTRFDRHWVRSIAATLSLVGLVAAAIGGGWEFTLSALVTCAVGFGFFYLLFPGGAHFGVTVANFLAVYACLFVFFRQANFPAAPPFATIGGLALPVLGFLVGCLLRRRQVLAIIRAAHPRDFSHLPRLMRGFAATMAVGALSFALPRYDYGPGAQGMLLIAAMAAITGLVVLSVRDVVVVLRDVAAIFESVAARLDRLLIPMLAFLMFYGLLVVIFGCLCRIADLTSTLPQFALHGAPVRIDFVDALYYSIAAITTLGLGDFSPATPLVRALTGVEVVAGVLMLLFGFSEIMRARDGTR